MEHVVCFQLIIIMVVLDSTLTFLLGYDTIGSSCIPTMDLNDLRTCFPSLGIDNINMVLISDTDDV